MRCVCHHRGGGGALTYSNLQESLRQRAESIANKVNHVVESVSQAGERQRVISAMGADKDITFIAVIGGVPPRILVSTRQAWVGRRLADIPSFQQREDIALALNTRVVQSYALPDSNELSVTIPLLLRDGNSKVALQNGVAVVHLDTRSTYRAAWTAALISTIGFVLIFSLVGTIGYILFRRQVLTPLSMINRHLSNRQTGEVFPASMLAGTNEISVVAMALDQALTSSEQSEEALRESEKRFRMMFERTADALLLLDPELGQFIDCNQATTDMLCCTDKKEFLFLHPSKLSPLHQPDGRRSDEKAAEMIATALRNGSHRFEWIHCSAHRADFPVEVLLTPILLGEKQLLITTWRDITERKQIEQMKSEFVSTVSHELRTPLTAISGALGLVMGGVLGEVPQQMREMISLAHKNSQRLTHMVNDLLDMDKLTAGQMAFNIQTQPLMPLIEQALEENRTYGTERGVMLVLTGAAPAAEVSVDSQRLMQVMSNLLSNAIKYSPDQGTVAIAVEQQGVWVRVSVIDHGPGIPTEFYDRIFQKFSQADSSDTRQKGGSGLGLAIAREMVERMGGKIGFESVEGEGATFFIELPLSNGKLDAQAHR